MASKRVRGFAKWNPAEDSQETLQQVIEVLEEYRDYWPLTIRQVFYRLVGRYDYPKTEKAYDKLGEKINRGRREYREVPWNLPWDAFRDDGVIDSPFHCYSGADDFWGTVQALASQFRFDLMSYQVVHLELFCEAAGMVPQLERVANQYGVNVSSSGGFDSTTRKHDLAKRLSGTGKPCVLLHIGDLDPSGVHMCSSLDEDIQAFCDHYGGQVEMVRLAVTPDQQAAYNLPTAPPKATDNRSFDSDFTVQAEALDPADLAQIVTDAIESQIDLPTLARARRQERAMRTSLLSQIESM